MAYTFRHGDRPLDGLTIQRAVGRGGFGEVYYALSDSGKQIAVKYLRENPEIELRGIAQVMNLKSPHLVTIYDVRRTAEGDPFVIMEYISGPSLRDILRAAPGGVGEQKAAFFVEGIGKGLAYLHERGIVHRDLKPGNIFYDDGYVKIGDYGLSKHISVSAHSGNTVSVGTVHYMAPEIGSGSYTRAIDIYALGVILYELLTGRLPFTGSSMGEILMRHLREAPDVAGIRKPFAEIITKALAKNPEDRYQDANEMIDALMTVSGVRESISTFNPSMLGEVPRDHVAADADRTHTSPPRPRPRPTVDMDVRNLSATDDLPPIPPIPDLLGGGRTPPPPPREPRRSRAQAHRAPAAPPPAGAAEVPGWRVAQAMVGMLTAVAAGALIGVLHGENHVAAGAGVTLMLVGASVGTLGGHFWLVRRLMTPHPFVIRVVYVSLATLFMMPGIAVSADVEKIGRLAIPLLASLVICDWEKIIKWGRRGDIGGGWLFWHALIGLIGASVFDAHGWYGVITCVALPLIVQTAAAIWPVPQPRPQDARHDERRNAWARIEKGVDRIVDRTADALDAAGRKLDEKFGKHNAGHDEGERAEENRGAAAAPRAGYDRPAAPIVIDAYEPSFVGRTANAGLAFVGKLLLLAGMALAFMINISEPFQVQSDGTFVSIGEGALVVRTQSGKEVRRPLPRAVVFVPFALGTVLLLAARRSSDTAHQVRAGLGCALGFAAAMLALGPAEPTLTHLINVNWTALREQAHERMLIVMGGLTIAALTLLFWPRARRPSNVVSV